MPRKKKRPDDAPVPASTEEQADVLEEESPPEAPPPDFVNPETAEDPADLVPDEPDVPIQEMGFGQDVPATPADVEPAAEVPEVESTQPGETPAQIS